MNFEWKQWGMSSGKFSTIDYLNNFDEGNKGSNWLLCLDGRVVGDIASNYGGVGFGARVGRGKHLGTFDNLTLAMDAVVAEVLASPELL